MLHFHATQKLLNTSRIKPVLYVSEPSPGQRLHNWYVVLCGSGFTGKMLLLFIHEPSLLTVVVKGKTIASTIDNFRKQLKQLLYRHDFPKTFIEKEMLYAADYIVGKTGNKSMLAHINQMVLQVTTYNLRYASYDEIDTAVNEDIFMDWMYKSKGQKDYQTPLKYWMKELGEHPLL
jgi:hypothetical protein